MVKVYGKFRECVYYKGSDKKNDSVTWKMPETDKELAERGCPVLVNLVEICQEANSECVRYDCRHYVGNQIDKYVFERENIGFLELFEDEYKWKNSYQYD